jgi:hypothetical protein
MQPVSFQQFFKTPPPRGKSVYPHGAPPRGSRTHDSTLVDHRAVFKERVTFFLAPLGLTAAEWPDPIIYTRSDDAHYAIKATPRGFDVYHLHLRYSCHPHPEIRLKATRPITVHPTGGLSVGLSVRGATNPALEMTLELRECSSNNVVATSSFNVRAKITTKNTTTQLRRAMRRPRTYAPSPSPATTVAGTLECPLDNVVLNEDLVPTGTVA